MADLIDLGFELSAQKAESAIDRLMDKFNQLEKTKSSVSKLEFTGMENLSQVASQFRTISSSVTKINKMFGGAAASEAAKQVDSLNIRIGETGKLMQEIGNYRFKTGAELAAQQIKVFETSLSSAASKLSELSVVQQKISYGGTSSTPAGMSKLAEQLGKLEGQIAPLGGSFKTTFTVITQAIGQAKTQAARFNGEVSKIAVSLNKTGTSIGKITAQMRQLAEAVSRTALRTAASEGAMRKMASVNPVNPAAIASVDQLKMKLQEASLAARSFRPIGKIGGSVSVGGLRDMTGGFNSANFAARNLRDTLISMATGGGLAYYFADVTRAAVKFGEELSYIQSLTLDFSKQDMRSGILNMGSMLGDATKNAEAAYYAYSSGVRGGEKGIINFTGNMAKLAKIIRADVIPTVNSVTTIMNAYNLTAADSAELTDLFYGIIKQGKANGPQLASGLGQVASTAATADLSLNELGAAVASLTKVNSTRNAITYLNNMLSKMIKPTKEARLAAANLGIELGLDAVRAKGFTGMMQEIREKTQGSQQALLALFPDLRGQRAALQLLNRGWDDFNKQLGFFANKAGIADEAFQNLEEDLNQQLGALPVTFNKIKIAAGDTITNILTLGGTLAPLIRDFNNMDESGQKLAGGIALVVGGLVTMKIAGLTLNTVKAMEIRNNAIILEQQKQELRNRAALTMAAAKEAAAKKAAAAVTMPGVIPAAGKTVTKKPAASTAVDMAMATIKAAKASSAASAPTVDSKAIASMQSVNALKLQYAAEGVKNAAAAKKAAEAYYAERSAIYASAIAKANDAKETSALTTMMKQDAQWRMKMASVNQSHLGSLTAIAQAEKANAAAAYQMAVADEKAARIKASLAVTGARLAGTPLENAKAGLDAANASLLSASMKEKEVLANAKLSASEIANMTAIGKGVLTRKDKLAMVDRILSRVALEKSQMLDAARAEEQAALATRDFIAQDRARLNVKAAEQAFLKAEAAAAKGRIAYMKAENKILAMNIALQKRRAVGNSFTKIIEGQGFIGGFGRSGVANLRAAKEMFTPDKNFWLLKSTMNQLSVGAGKLSASFLGLIPIVTKIGIVAGAVAAVGGLLDVLRTKKVDNGLDKADLIPDWMQNNDMVRSWNNMVSNSKIVSKVVDNIYNYFTGAFDKAKEFDERMKMLAESRGQIFANMDTLFSLTDKYLQDSSDPKKMTGSTLETLQKNYKMAYDNLTTGTFRTMQAELKNATVRLAKLQPEIARGFNMSEAVARLNKKFNADLKIQNGEVVAEESAWRRAAIGAISGVSPVTGIALNLSGAAMSDNNRKALEAYKAEKAAFDAKIQEQNDLMKKSEEMTNAIAKGKAEYEKYATQLVSYWKAQKEALESMSDMIAKQRFNMLDPNEQINKLIENADAGFDGFTKLMKSNTKNASMLYDSLKGFVTPANDAIARLKKNIEGFDKMIESTMKSAFDYRYAGAKTDADRIKMMQDRAAKLMKESGMVSGNRTFDLTGIKDKDLDKSNTKVTEAIRLQVDAKKIEIERYKQLAEAERRANEKTLDLIRSMDKMSVTAVDAVDATSLDAVKLQSRSFAELPQMNFAQNAENDLGSAQQELQQIYERAAKIAEAFTQKAETRKQADQDSVNALNEKITTAMGQVEKKIETIEKTVKDNNEKIKQEIMRIEGEKAAMMRTIATYVQRIGENVGRL